MARIQVPSGGGHEMTRVWGLAPHLVEGVHALGRAVYEQSSLPMREREAARMRIAQLNACDI